MAPRSAPFCRRAYEEYLYTPSDLRKTNTRGREISFFYRFSRLSGLYETESELLTTCVSVTFTLAGKKL